MFSTTWLRYATTNRIALLHGASESLADVSGHLSLQVTDVTDDAGLKIVAIVTWTPDSQVAAHTSPGRNTNTLNSTSRLLGPEEDQTAIIQHMHMHRRWCYSFRDIID